MYGLIPLLWVPAVHGTAKRLDLSVASSIYSSDKTDASRLLTSTSFSLFRCARLILTKGWTDFKTQKLGESR